MFTIKNILKRKDIIKRGFWTLNKGNSIGYVEGISKRGIIFKHKNMNFRQTSSNVAHGEVFYLAIPEWLSESILKEAMDRTKQVKIQFKTDVIGSPLKGEICGPNYLLDVEILDNGTVNVPTTVS